MDYHGPVVNLAARVSGAGHGGQVLLSPEAYEEIKDELHSLCEDSEEVDIQNLGAFSFKGIPEGWSIFGTFFVPFGTGTQMSTRGTHTCKHAHTHTCTHTHTHTHTHTRTHTHTHTHAHTHIHTHIHTRT